MPWTAAWMFWHILRWKRLVALAYQKYSLDYVNCDMHLVVYIERALEYEDKAYWYSLRYQIETVGWNRVSGENHLFISIILFCHVLGCESWARNRLFILHVLLDTCIVLDTWSVFGMYLEWVDKSVHEQMDVVIEKYWEERGLSGNDNKN